MQRTDPNALFESLCLCGGPCSLGVRLLAPPSIGEASEGDRCAQTSLKPLVALWTTIFRHFNAASLVDSAREWAALSARGDAMMVTLAGAMSTAELGRSLRWRFARQGSSDHVHWR